MVILTQEMKDAIPAIRLSFVATASLDGTPNVSPKGSLTVWDDEHLAFADIRSPRTIRNLRQNPKLEINTVDQMKRRGFRFRGTGEILESGDIFDHVAKEIRDREGDVPIHAIVKVRVTEAAPLLSPAYWLTENLDTDELRKVWAARYGYTDIVDTELP